MALQGQVLPKPATPKKGKLMCKPSATTQCKPLHSDNFTKNKVACKDL